MLDEIRAVIARNLRDYEVRSVAGLGEGLDNVVYEVNGELVVRRSKEADPVLRGELVRREAGVLAAAADLVSLAVPDVVFVDPDAGVLAYRKLQGVPLLDHPVAHPERLAPALGRFVGALHAAPLARMEALVPYDVEPMAAWLEEAEDSYRQVSELLPARARAMVEDFLGRTPPGEPTDMVFCHNDLGSEHVLVDEARGAVTGVIDWADAAIADPACDLALIYRDLGPEVFDLTLAHYNGTIDEAGRERAAFYARCALLEDVAYGLHSADKRYLHTGLAHLERTFHRLPDS